jgi:hypothetical protein
VLQTAACTWIQFTFRNLLVAEQSAAVASGLEHNGSAVIGWNSATAGSYNFLSLPGGGAVAGSYSLNGTTTTWVPLLDTDGSKIGLVNAANPDSGPATTYTYSPSGNPTASGTANDWPFKYQGMEKEFTDPAPYYYNGSGQFYSPQMVRSLSEAGQTSSSGSGGGPSGNSIAAPSGSSGGLSPQSVENDSRQAFQVGTDIYVSINALTPFLGPEAPVIALPLALIGGAIDFLVNFFEDIFSGSSSPEIPRQLLHARHPLYPVILGVSDDLIPDEVSLGKPQLCGDPSVCPHCPVHRKDAAPGPAAPPPGRGEYAKACAQCGPQDIYDCNIAPPICANTGKGPWSNCLRGCLQGMRSQEINAASCFGSYPFIPGDHAYCFAICP